MTMVSCPVGSTTRTVPGERAVPERHIFWPDAERDGVAGGPSRGDGKVETGPCKAKATAQGAQLARDQVHGGRADKACHKQVCGLLVHLFRGPELLQFTLMHDGDAVGHRHGFELVVRHIDEGLAEPAVQLDQLGPHVGAQFRIEIGEGLVQQEDLGVADERAPERNALLLTAGQLARLAVEKGLELKRRGRFSHLRLPLRARHAALLQGYAMFSATVMCG
jgi:hypothetical protein